MTERGRLGRTSSQPPRVLEPGANGELVESGPTDIRDVQKKIQLKIGEKTTEPDFTNSEIQKRIISTFCNLVRTKLGTGFDHSNPQFLKFTYNNIECRVSMANENSLCLLYGIGPIWIAFFNQHNAYIGFSKSRTDPLQQGFPNYFFRVLLEGLKTLRQ